MIQNGRMRRCTNPVNSRKIHDIIFTVCYVKKYLYISYQEDVTVQLILKFFSLEFKSRVRVFCISLCCNHHSASSVIHAFLRNFLPSYRRPHNQPQGHGQQYCPPSSRQPALKQNMCPRLLMIQPGKDPTICCCSCCCWFRCCCCWLQRRLNPNHKTFIVLSSMLLHHLLVRSPCQARQFWTEVLPPLRVFCSPFQCHFFSYSLAYDFTFVLIVRLDIVFCL
jgi:hypothetical protein